MHRRPANLRAERDPHPPAHLPLPSHHRPKDIASEHRVATLSLINRCMCQNKSTRKTSRKTRQFAMGAKLPKACKRMYMLHFWAKRTKLACLGLLACAPPTSCDQLSESRKTSRAQRNHLLPQHPDHTFGSSGGSRCAGNVPSSRELSRQVCVWSISRQ